MDCCLSLKAIVIHIKRKCFLYLSGGSLYDDKGGKSQNRINIHPMSVCRHIRDWSLITGREEGGATKWKNCRKLFLALPKANACTKVWHSPNILFLGVSQVNANVKGNRCPYIEGVEFV